jgi:hypothetical protein
VHRTLEYPVAHYLHQFKQTGYGVCLQIQGFSLAI